MPSPGPTESEDEFISRCMSDEEAMSDFPDEDQRYAVCISKWEGKADGFSPNEAMAREATRGLEWRDEFSRGGTEIGVARARDIKNRRNLSLDTVKRMVSYFARHEVDKQGQGFSPGEDGYPSAGRIAWALWSGDPGRAWAEAIVAKIDDKKSSASLFFSHLRTLSATGSKAAVLSFFDDCVVTFDKMTSRAGFKFMRDEVLISSTLEVLATWHRLKVNGVDATSVATKMIDMKSGWDWADDLLVRKSMSWDGLFTSPNTYKSEIPISTAVFCSSPIPAIVLAKALVDLFPESFSSTLQSNLRCVSPQSVSQARKEVNTMIGEIQHKNVSLTLKREPDNDGVFEGYASVFGVVDQGMDVVERGAFRKSLGSRKVKMLWQHDMSQPIGVWDDIYEDERGLFVRGRLLKEVEKGREAMALLRAGAIDSMSIGYRTMEAIPEGDGRVRKLMEVDLFEISLVTFPMLPDAKVTNVKSITTERDFERFLRDAGYSRKEAVALTLHGFKALQRQRDAGDEEAVTEGVDALLQSLSKLKESLHVRGNQEGRRRG